MAEKSMAFEQVVRAQLRFTGSEALRDAVNHSLVKPYLRQAFAKRGFYLCLRTEDPVDIIYSYGEVDRPLHTVDPLDTYNAGIAQSHKGKDLYINQYNLSSHIIGAADYDHPHPGVSLLFQATMSAYEKQRLLSPPFDGVTAGPVYVTHEINKEWLADSHDQSVMYEQMRIRLGAHHPETKQSGYLADRYYVTHPEGIVEKVRYRNSSISDNPAV